EMSEKLEGQADVRVTNLSWGDFDPLAATARAAGWGTLAPERSEVILRQVDAALSIDKGRVSLKALTLPLGGARFVLAGTYGFDGVMDVHVRADFGHGNRRWSGGVDPDIVGRVALLHLTGPLDRPTAALDEGPSIVGR
ncbi:MAG: hypothetical protein ACREH9_13030, partial [Pseudomonadota bacterium]